MIPTFKFIAAPKLDPFETGPGSYRPFLTQPKSSFAASTPRVLHPTRSRMFRAVVCRGSHPVYKGKPQPHHDALALRHPFCGAWRDELRESAAGQWRERPPVALLA